MNNPFTKTQGDKFANSENVRWVGALLPPPLAEHLILLTLNLGNTKSAFFRDLIEKELSFDFNSVDTLIKSLIAKAVVNWQQNVELNRGKKSWQTEKGLLIKLNQYKNELTAELVKRKIPDKWEKQIVLTAVKIIKEGIES